MCRAISHRFGDASVASRRRAHQVLSFPLGKLSRQRTTSLRHQQVARRDRGHLGLAEPPGGHARAAAADRRPGACKTDEDKLSGRPGQTRSGKIKKHQVVLVYGEARRRIHWPEFTGVSADTISCGSCRCRSQLRRPRWPPHQNSPWSRSVRCATSEPLPEGAPGSSQSGFGRCRGLSPVWKVSARTDG